MSSIESLKETARRHEQREEWQKALDEYRKAIDRLEAEEQPDIALYNRVGDLQTRIGRMEAAVEAYTRAVDLYVESDLPNNAIAVCKKIIRNMPLQHEVYLQMGRIRAKQGFLVEARDCFLTYAGRIQTAGDLDEALRSLTEFADLAPDDLDMRLALAAQLEQQERSDDALEQLGIGYRAALGADDGERAPEFEERIHALDPSADLEEIAAVEEEPVALSGDDHLSSFQEISLDEAEDESGQDDEVELVAEIAHPSEEESTDGTLGDKGEVDSAEAGDEPQLEPIEAIEDADALALEEGLTEAVGEVASDELEEIKPDSLEVADDEAGVVPADPDSLELDEILGLPDEEEEEEEWGEPLPTFGLDESKGVEDEGSEEDEGGFAPLPTFGFDADEASEEETSEEVERDEPLPTFGFDADEVDDVVGVEGEAPADTTDDPATMVTTATARIAEGSVDEAVALLQEARDGFESVGDLDGALDAMRSLVTVEPDVVEHRQRVVEIAFRMNDNTALADAYLELAECMERIGEDAKARPLFEQVLNLDPGNTRASAALKKGAGVPGVASEVASSEEYVDLGGLILDDEEDEKSTRFTVAYEEPSGDEQADFAKMLEQFKQKVSQNLEADDVRAHHDLGTAYKEMGLLDEAISEFQAALRASSHHLPTYELLGQVFMEKGEHEAAVRSLERALDAPFEVEDELISIYYQLGVAHEKLGNASSAKEFFERVFSLDINFADVTERLRELR